MAMHVLAGLELEGASLVERDDRVGSVAALGEPVWSSSRLLTDLELRLGLSHVAEPRGVRVACWQARLLALSSRESRYYSRSLELDPLGTAMTLLDLRDSLVEAGWEGQELPDGGERLQALVELERCREPALPVGPADRLRRVEQALARSPHRIYEELCVAESVELWPLRWQHCFASLERQGTRVRRLERAAPGASRDGDLRRIQDALERGAPGEPVAIAGDGSFVLLTADTSWEAARATAALLGELDAGHTVVIREGDGSALDHALATLGLPTQGLRAQSPYRGALQILPLALELAFEPRDPHRVLELLTAPNGPFHGRAGRRLSHALSRSPAVGSPTWKEEKAGLIAEEKARVSCAANDVSTDGIGERITEWLEGPTADPVEGATKEELLQLVARVHAWLLSRIARSPEDGSLLSAASSAAAFRVALEHDSRVRFNLLEVRKLSSVVLGEGSTVALAPEQSGRIAHVERAASLAASRRNLVWWFFADTGRRPARQPWRSGELNALSRAGVRFPDPRARLVELSRQRRRALACATERAILVAPRTYARERLTFDPVWDELQAWAQLDDSARERVTVEARQLLGAAGASGVLRPPRQVPVQPAALPGGHVEWRTEPFAVGTGVHSATSLESLLACPLRWVLSYPGKLRSTRRTLPPPHQLAGTLGHRLVEVLHQQGAFDQPEGAFEERARAELSALIAREGALLLRPGRSFERAQLEEQLVRAVVELARCLRSANLRITAVEQTLRRPWRSGELEGRVDLLVSAPDGREHILDLKYGARGYRMALQEGRALQLAVYGAVHGHGRGRSTEGAFFSLKQARLIGLAGASLPLHQELEGRSLADTWAAVERTVDALEGVLEQGRISVTGLRRALPLLDTLGIEPSEQPSCFSTRRESICQYCQLDVLCGRRWEGEHEQG